MAAIIGAIGIAIGDGMQPCSNGSIGWHRHWTVIGWCDWRQLRHVQFYLTLLPKFSFKFNRVQYQLILIYITWDKETYLFTIFPLALNYEFQAIDHLTNESKNWDDIILLTCKLIVPLPISIM